MYVNNRFFGYALHVWSSSYGGVYLNSFWRPISAMSLLKFPHNICVWFGCESICILIVCCVIGINLISSMCEGMYICYMSHDCNGWFFMCMIWR